MVRANTADMSENQAGEHQPNTTDASAGQHLLARVQARTAELETAVAATSTPAHVRAELQAALSEIAGLLTGDLANIPQVVDAQLSRWLEVNKHLDEHHDAPAEEPRTGPPRLVVLE